MAIDAYGNTATTATTTASSTTAVKNKTSLSKNDFMTLLLAELKHQDPTKPTDTQAILTQTSQLSSLDASTKMNATLEKLSKSMSNSQEFSTIAAIGKTADLGSDAISHDKGTNTTFKLYFPKDVKNGTVSITDGNGDVVKTLNVDAESAGIHQFQWDGSNSAGKQAGSGVYHVTSKYTDTKGTAQQTKLGVYPIEAVRFDKGDALIKVGSSYVPLTKIKEIY